MLSLEAIAVTTVFLLRRKRAAARLMVILAAIFVLGIAVVFIGAFLHLNVSLRPAYVPRSSANFSDHQDRCHLPMGFHHICRLRTDEFAVIMTRITSEEKELVLTKIERENYSLQVEKENMPAVFLNVGVAFSEREEPEGGIFQDADIALKRLKDKNQTGYAVFEARKGEPTLTIDTLTNMEPTQKRDCRDV